MLQCDGLGSCLAWAVTTDTSGHWTLVDTGHDKYICTMKCKGKNDEIKADWNIGKYYFVKIINHIKSETHQEDAKDAVDEDYA